MVLLGSERVRGAGAQAWAVGLQGGLCEVVAPWGKSSQERAKRCTTERSELKKIFEKQTCEHQEGGGGGEGKVV